MFDTSIIMLLKYILVLLILPLTYGILFIRSILGNKIKWVLFYILSWFSWIFLVSFLVFDLNFLFKNIYPYNLIISYIILVTFFFISVYTKKINLKQLLHTFKINISLLEIKQNFKQLNITEKFLTIFFFIYSIIFLITWFIFKTNLPSFADDTFWNWNKPSINMYYDNKIIMFGEKNEILWKWRLWYPIYIPLYKTIIAKITWSWNDIYVNLLNYLIFILFITFLRNITYNLTKNIFYTWLSWFLIMSLPLVFYHSVSGYMDLYSAVISVIAIYLIFLYFKKKDIDYLILAIFFLIWLAYIKNDGFVIYTPWIIFATIVTILLQNKLKYTLKSLNNKKFITNIIIFILFFFLPFLFLKKYYNLWFNQAAGVQTWIGLEKPHWEIFNVFPTIFLNEGNYNIILIWILLSIFISFSLLKKKSYKLIFVLSPVFIFILFNLAFLITANYKWVLNQTTVNRVFTMVFVILLAFLSILIFDHTNDNKKNN